MAHSDQKEAELLYQELCHYLFDEGDARVSFSEFDEQGRPTLFGMDDLKANMFGRTIKYYPDEKRWKIVNDCGEVVAWTDQEPIHPHLVPDLWYQQPGGQSVYDSHGHLTWRRAHDWYDQPDVMRQHQGTEEFCHNYNFHVKKLIKLVSKRFPGIPSLPS